MKIHTLATLATAASLLAFSIANAQGAAPPKPKVACAADIQRFCPTAAPGKETMQCMRSHMSEASAGCQSAVQAHRAMMRQQKAAAAQGAPSAPPPSPQ
jgi:hypothetical protein